MRRQRREKSAVGVSLFPFLAVLICTMGALIVLLVLVVQQARVQADTITEDRKKQEDEARNQRKLLLEEREDYEWQQQVIETQRAELAQQLADKRLELSHLEDHIRRLEEKWQQMRDQVDQMKASNGGTAAQLAEAEYELARLLAAIKTERERLDRTREEVTKRRRSYSIIPYQGPNGTKRRPIYVECRESGIVIQPEGIVLGPDDFNGPLGPGNPLDAALRAIREYWSRIEAGKSLGEPYPLLVVRPNGSVAYSMARGAIASWDDEFGYELVDADLELNYPPPDQRLKKILENAIKLARQRQAILASAMPSRFPQGSRQGFVASPPQGGFGGEFGSGDGAEGYGGGDGPAGSTGSGRGAGRSANQPASRTGSRTGSRPGEFDAMARNGQASRRGAPGDAATNQGFYGSAGGPPQDGAGYAANQSGGSSQASGTQRNGRPGQSGSQPSGSGRSQGASSSQGGGSAAAGSDLQSVAQTKGRNWGLPNVAAGSTAITRPVSVQCHSDRLVILPDRGTEGQPVVIRFEESVDECIEQFVSGIWTHMDAWGIAVSGGYWKPVAKVQVVPGAEAKYRELEILLEDSGIEIERK